MLNVHFVECKKDAPDDAKMYRHIHRSKDCILLQYTLNGLQSWSQKWLFSLNIQKCCVVSYSRSVDKSINYVLVQHSNQETVLERCDTVKDLGVWFNE